MDTLGYDQVPPRNTNAVLGDSYIIGRRIGRGAMGEVYEAQHVRLPGQFAVKLLLPELQGNQDAFARFCREAEIMSQLRHPHIVQIFDFNVAPDARPYFVMEYLQGRDLEARVQSGPLPLPAVARIVDAVASALALAHAHGVVHRDLKPANIFLATVDGQTDELVKVLDFGISKVRSAVAQISQAVDLLGTPSYMSPEQARGHGGAIDGRTDQFALGAIAYRMLTGQEPFQGDDSAAVLYQVVHEDPLPLSLFLPSAWDPDPLQAVLDRALAKNPDDRFGGMMELARAFDDAAERTIGTAREDGGLRASPVLRAPRLDDAALDTPPPVRTPTPVIVSPPRKIPTRLPTPPAATPQIIDWELPSSIDRPPATHHRGALFGLLLLALAGTLIVTGWYRRLPAVGAGLRQRIHEWTRPPGGSGEPPADAPRSQTPAPDDEPRGGAANVQPSPAPADDTAATRAETAPPPPKPPAHHRLAARSHRSRAPRFAPPPPPVAGEPVVPAVPVSPGTTPPLNGRAFEIAPPPPMSSEPRRDLAPGNDDTLPPSQ